METTLICLISNRLFQGKVVSIFYLLILLVTWLSSMLLSSLAKLQTSVITQNIRADTKEILFRHILPFPEDFFISQEAGSIEHNISAASYCCRYIFEESLQYITRTFIAISITILILSSFSYYFAVLFGIWALLYSPFSYILARTNTKAVQDSLRQSALVSGAIVDVVSNHDLVRSFSTETYERNRMHDALEEERKQYHLAQTRIDINHLLQKIALFGLIVTMMLYAFYATIGSDLMPGAFIAVFVLFLVIAAQLEVF